ncbi:hypothetical protein B4915_08720 [Leucobacter massiliensis]|uniref:Uncharacterized protein n=1 Tax=Leucobacter massiliensis TaxID=1686285 RepID=A0A2S9QN16_9MICO|nr:hypothetical protein B4915_08720 [Leucobacter massiliensis]
MGELMAAGLEILREDQSLIHDDEVQVREAGSAQWRFEGCAVDGDAASSGFGMETPRDRMLVHVSPF